MFRVSLRSRENVDRGKKKIALFGTEGARGKKRGEYVFGDTMGCCYARVYVCTLWLTRERAETWRDAAECKNCQGASPIKSSRNWRRSEREQVVSNRRHFPATARAPSWKLLGGPIFTRALRLPYTCSQVHWYTGCPDHVRSVSNYVSKTENCELKFQNLTNWIILIL